MKISKLEFENFRNFKGHNVIEFPTDGRVSIIYGTNGDGKTTLHQLFQWIFYGEVHFNKTASDKMYNLQSERELVAGNKLKVFGSVDFEHPNKEGVVEYYSLRREWVYHKGVSDTKLLKDECSFVLMKKKGDDWKKVSKDPASVIERILPSGLSQYFFFDGESMIADLNQKGKDSAKSLRKALYSIFDIDIYEQAVVHIGAQSAGKTTVLGNLYLSKSDGGTDTELLALKGLVTEAQNKFNECVEKKNENEETLKNLRKALRELSEQIGEAQDQKELESQRKLAKKNIESFEKSIDSEKKMFGKDIYKNYPYLLMGCVIRDAQNRIGLKVGEEHLIPELKKPFIEALLNEKTCVCGRELTEKEYDHLREFFKMLPPLSYKSMYDDFTKSVTRWATTYDESMLLNHMESIFDYMDSIEENRARIKEIDDTEKDNLTKFDLINQRAQTEIKIDFYEKELVNIAADGSYWEKIRNQRMKKYDEASDKSASNKELLAKIEIMEKVREYFSEKILSVSKEYSEKLGEMIQELINEMLTSERAVTMSPNFDFVVKDSFGDEAKSEGQFAVISFAYIGGIFKLLSQEPILKDKEYPLILDGPFSKLDVIQRQNVIDTIPSYAPQVILFSKDDLSECFKEDVSSSTWTLFSNKEKNVAEIKKGYFPEVFELNGYNN